MHYVFDYIQKIHKKPEEYRRRVALLVAVVITSVVVGIWILTIPTQFGRDRKNTKQMETQSSPFAILKDTLSGSFTDISFDNNTTLTDPVIFEVSTNTASSTFGEDLFEEI